MEITLFEQALGIQDPWYITKVDFTVENKRLDIYIDFKAGTSFCYEEEWGCKVHDTKQKTWRHLNFFDHECYLHARVPRVKTQDNKVKMVKAPWAGISPGFTLLFEALVLNMVKHMPVHVVSRFIKESDNKIWTMAERYVEESRKHENHSQVKKVGTDETSRAKGHNYISLFVDLEARKTLYITEGKDHTTVQRFKADLEKHQGTAENIEQVSIDMSKSFIKGFEESFVNAEITFDKFHTVAIINKAVDKVRRQEALTQPILKKSRYVFLKNEQNYKKKECQKLQELQLSKLNLKSMRAKHIRDNFQEIYKAETEEQFIVLLKKWYFWATHSQIDQIKDAAKTIKNHWNGIASWFRSNINNGILEGLNSVIQAAKRKARGFKTFKNLKIIAYLITAKLDFSQINKSYLPT